jgi:hypothetical protein
VRGACLAHAAAPLTHSPSCEKALTAADITLGWESAHVSRSSSGGPVGELATLERCRLATFEMLEKLGFGWPILLAACVIGCSGPRPPAAEGESETAGDGDGDGGRRDRL